MNTHILSPVRSTETVQIAVTKLSPVLCDSKYIVCLHFSTDFGETWTLSSHSAPSSYPQNIPNLQLFTEIYPSPPQPLISSIKPQVGLNNGPKTTVSSHISPTHSQQVTWFTDNPDDHLTIDWSLDSMMLLCFEIRALADPDDDHGKLIIPFAELFKYFGIEHEYPLVSRQNKEIVSKLTLLVKEPVEEEYPRGLSASFALEISNVAKFGILKGPPSTSIQFLSLDDDNKPQSIIYQSPISFETHTPTFPHCVIHLEYLTGDPYGLYKPFQIRVIYYNEKTNHLGATAGWCNLTLKDLIRSDEEHFVLKFNHVTKKKIVKMNGLINLRELRIHRIPYLSKHFFGNPINHLTLSFCIDFSIIHDQLYSKNILEIIHTFSEIFSPLTNPHDFSSYQVYGMLPEKYRYLSKSLQNGQGHRQPLSLLDHQNEYLFGHPEHINCINYAPYVTPEDPLTSPTTPKTYFNEYINVKDHITPNPDTNFKQDFDISVLNSYKTLTGLFPQPQFFSSKKNGNAIILPARPGHSILVYITNTDPSLDKNLFNWAYTCPSLSIIVVGVNTNAQVGKNWETFLSDWRLIPGSNQRIDRPNQIQYIQWNLFSTISTSVQVEKDIRGKNRLLFGNVLNKLYQNILFDFLLPASKTCFDLHSLVQDHNDWLTNIPQWITQVDQRSDIGIDSCPIFDEVIQFTAHKIQIKVKKENDEKNEQINSSNFHNFQNFQNIENKYSKNNNNDSNYSDDYDLDPISDINPESTTNITPGNFILSPSTRFFIELIISSDDLTPTKTSPSPQSTSVSLGYSDLTNDMFFPHLGSQFETIWSPVEFKTLRIALYATQESNQHITTTGDKSDHILVGVIAQPLTQFVSQCLSGTEKIPFLLNPTSFNQNDKNDKNDEKIQIFLTLSGSISSRQKRGKIIAFRPIIAAPQFQLSIDTISPENRAMATNLSHAIDFVRISDQKIVYRSPRYSSGLSTLPTIILDLDQLLAGVDDYDTINPPVFDLDDFDNGENDDDKVGEFGRGSVGGVSKVSQGREGGGDSGGDQRGRGETIGGTIGVKAVGKELNGPRNGILSVSGGNGDGIANSNESNKFHTAQSSDLNFPNFENNIGKNNENQVNDDDDVPPPPPLSEIDENLPQTPSKKSHGPQTRAPRRNEANMSEKNNEKNNDENDEKLQAELLLARQRLLAMEFEVRHIIYSPLERKYIRYNSAMKVSLKQLLQFSMRWKNIREIYQQKEILQNNQKNSFGAEFDIKIAREKIGSHEFWLNPTQLISTPDIPGLFNPINDNLEPVNIKKISKASDVEYNYKKFPQKNVKNDTKNIIFEKNEPNLNEQILAKISSIPIKISPSFVQLFNRPSFAQFIGDGRYQLLPTFSIDFGIPHDDNLATLVNQVISYCTLYLSPLTCGQKNISKNEPKSDTKNNSPTKSVKSFIVTGFGDHVPFESHIEHRLTLSSGFIHHNHHQINQYSYFGQNPFNFTKNAQNNRNNKNNNNSQFPTVPRPDETTLPPSPKSNNSSHYPYLRPRPAILTKGMSLEGSQLQAHKDRRGDWLYERKAQGLATDINMAGAIAVTTGMASFYLTPMSNVEDGRRGSDLKHNNFPPALDWGVLNGNNKPILTQRRPGHTLHICIVTTPFPTMTKGDFKQLLGEANLLGTSVVFVFVGEKNNEKNLVEWEKNSEKWKKVGNKHFYFQTHSATPGIKTEVPQQAKIHHVVIWDHNQPDQCMVDIMKFVYTKTLEQLISHGCGF